MRVTFDSQNWQPVVRPDKFPKDPRNPNMVKINAALGDGRVKGFIVDTVATLEGIRRVDRGKYFAGHEAHRGWPRFYMIDFRSRKPLAFGSYMRRGSVWIYRQRFTTFISPSRPQKRWPAGRAALLQQCVPSKAAVSESTRSKD